MHRGTRKCELAQQAVALKGRVHTAWNELDRAGKVPVSTNIATALQRRGLSQLAGLEIADTKLVYTDMECYIKEEPWVHRWVKWLWKKHNDEGYTRTFYTQMEQIQNLPPEEREKEVGLILLRSSDQW